MWKKGLLVVIVVSVGFSSLAQKKEERLESSFIEQPSRIELDISDDDQDYMIVPAEEDGLLVFRETYNRGDGGFFWEFNHLDTTLTNQWTKTFPLPYGSFFMGHDYSLGNVFILLGTVRGRSFDQFQLLGMNLATGDTVNHIVDIGFPVDLKEFEVVGDMAIFGGYANYRAVIVLYNLTDRKKKVLPGFYNMRSELLDIKTDDDNRQFSVLMTDRFRAKNQSIQLKTYDDKGFILQSSKLDPGREKNLIYGQSTKFNEGSQYISGTFAQRRSSYSKGVYMAKFEDNQQEYLKYFNYADLENFFSYMSAKRRDRVKERIKRRKIKGKRVRLNYRLLVHDVLKLGDVNILIGEAYYPKYVLSTYGPLHLEYYRDTYGTGIEGYRYTHAVVIAFNESGDIVWDNSFEINDILTLDLKQFVHVAGDEDRIVLLYMYEGEVRSKLIEGNEVVEGKTYNPIRLKFEDDIIESKADNVEGLEKWYGNSFYAYGIQRIVKGSDRKRREIFYINKISYK